MLPTVQNTDNRNAERLLVESGGYMQIALEMDTSNEGLTQEERLALCHVFDENEDVLAETARFSDWSLVKTGTNK